MFSGVKIVKNEKILETRRQRIEESLLEEQSLRRQLFDVETNWWQQTKKTHLLFSIKRLHSYLNNNKNKIKQKKKNTSVYMQMKMNEWINELNFSVN